MSTTMSITEVRRAVREQDGRSSRQVLHAITDTEVGSTLNARRTFFAAALLAVMGAAGSTAFAQTGTRLPWQSNFDQGNASEWDGLADVTGVQWMSSGCVSGRCLRAPLIANQGNDNYADFYFADHMRFGSAGRKVEELYLSLYVKFDPGYTWANRSQKIAIINLTDGVTNDRHYQVYFYVTPQGQYAITNSDIDRWLFWGIFQNIGTPSPVRFGQWDKLKLYVKLNTPGQANGIVKMWVNDVLKSDHNNINIRFNSSMGMNKLILSSATTQLNGGTGGQWWDNFKLQTTDPDAGAVAPNPPSNVRVE
jgi:hypothetical protein